MFIQNCFIRKNTKELCQILNEIGYKVLPNLFGMVGLSTMTNGICVPSVSNARDMGYDCGENEDLFLAISALRDDSDYMQWFVTDHNEWYKSIYSKEYCYNKKRTIDGINIGERTVHKATIEELIKHFKKE